MKKRTVGSFDGPFAPMLDLFVKQKQALGYDYVGGYNALHVFDTFSKRYEVKNYELSKEIVLAWSQKRPNENDTTRSARIMYLQHFAIFLNSQGYSGYIAPPQKYHFSQHTAYVFTKAEIKKLFISLDQMEYTPNSPYCHLSFPLLYRMLYGCGFRISELLNLTVGDVDIERGIIHIHDSKNGNERLVPMAATLAARCRTYTESVHNDHEEDFPFFFKKDGTGYCVSNIERHFREQLWLAGIPYLGKELGPRVHDLRHTFICHRLNQWAKEGVDLTAMLPILSKYVGHTGIASTQYYLKLTAEAFPDVLEQMDELTGHVFPEVGGVMLTLDMLNVQQIEDFMLWLKKERNCGASTCNQRLGALKSFFRYLQFALPDCALQCQENLAIRPMKQPEPGLKYLTIDGIKLLLEQPDIKTKYGRRDLAILSLMYDTGARVQEIADIKIVHIRFSAPATIRITGKGDKTRVVPLLSRTEDILKQYIKDFKIDAGGNDAYLFQNRSGQQLSRFGISYILTKYADMARKVHPELIPEKLSPHCIRHSKAMHLLQANVNLVYIRDLLGHSSVTTTEIYARADTTLKREALEKANPIKDTPAMPQWNSDDGLMEWLRTLGK